MSWGYLQAHSTVSLGPGTFGLEVGEGLGGMGQTWRKGWWRAWVHLDASDGTGSPPPPPPHPPTIFKALPALADLTATPRAASAVDFQIKCCSIGEDIRNTASLLSPRFSLLPWAEG